MKSGYHVSPWVAASRQEPADGEVDFWDVCWRALDEIAATHWDGVEVAQGQFEQYHGRPGELKREFDSRGLELITFYFARQFDQMTPQEAVKLARPRCEFHQAMGSSVLLIDGVRRGEGPQEDRIRAAADCINAVAELAREHGLISPWHIHHGSIFERSAAFDRLMELTDPDLVTICPDTAQMALGDYNLEKMFEKYAERISYVHFKDIAFLDGKGGYLPDIPPGFCEKGAWGPDRIAEVLEPGQGVVDVAGLFSIIESAGFDGWVVVDLDYALTTPIESSRVSRENLAKLIPGLELPV